MRQCSGLSKVTTDFVKASARFPTVCKETLADLARGQQPYATILGCSDSRVPPELIFDANFGELFIIRVAGNVISPEVMGSMQYAGAHLHTPLFVVLGHEGCGAVKAAVDSKLDAIEHRSRIQILVDNILPGLPEFDPQAATTGARLHEPSKPTFDGRCTKCWKHPRRR